jgi:glycosyltransferase involved in cell wall biosynthesis
MPEVSVVVPAYNRAATLRRALDSALGQSVQDIELLVINDGSTDETAAVAAAVGDPRVRILRHAVNRGAAAARNTGIRAAGAPFIAFLDSDDAWLPGKLAAQLAALRAAPREQMVSCHGVRIHLLDHGVSRDQPLLDSPDWFARLLRDCDLSPGATLLARREAFDRVGLLDETLPRFEDWDWLLRYAAAGGTICALRGPLAVVWNRRGRLGEQHELSARRFLAKHAALYARRPMAERRAAVCDIWLQVAGTYAFQGRTGAAFRSALRAAMRRPLHCALRVLRHSTARAAARLRLGGALLQPGRAAH